MIYNTDRFGLAKTISFCDISKNRLWTTILDVINNGVERHMINNTVDDGEYVEGIDYEGPVSLLKNIMGLPRENECHTKYSVFLRDYADDCKLAAKYCGYNVSFEPTGKYKAISSGESIPDRLVIRVQVNNNWSGKIELTNDVITQKLVNEFREICKIAKENDKKYIAENIYEMCIIDSGTAMYNWTVEKVQIMIDNFVEGDMKSKIIDGQVNLFKNDKKIESEVKDTMEIDVNNTVKGSTRVAKQELKTYVIDTFMSKYFGQYVIIHKKNLDSDNMSGKDRQAWNNLFDQLMEDVNRVYPYYSEIVNRDTIRKWVNSIPEFSAIRPKNRFKDKKELDIDRITDTAENVINVQSSNKIRTVYTGTVSEDELYKPTSTADSITVQLDETEIDEITNVKTNKEDETYIWEVIIEYQKVSGGIFKKYIDCKYSGRYIAKCANDAFVQALNYLKDNVTYNIIYPSSDMVAITKQGVVKTSC